MEKPPSIFRIDANDIADEKRLAYTQDVFMTVTILGHRVHLCDSPLREGVCTFCKAPTVATPHPDKEDVLPFSSSFKVLPDLLKHLLHHWSLQDLRLLGEILRQETPLVVVQDIIHVYQRQHPLGRAGLGALRIASGCESIDYDEIQCLAPDVYFVPLLNLFPLPGQGPFTAHLVLGRVTALLRLSSQARCVGKVDEDKQWVSFAAEHVHFPIGEHLAWRRAWEEAWEAYRLLNID